MSKRAPKTREQGGESDLAVLHPDRTQTIAGVRITMREYRFVEGIQLADRVQRVVNALGDVAMDGQSLTTTALRPAFAQYPDDVLALIAAACDQPEAWVRNLTDADGQSLMLLWWVTNADFFVRRVIEAVTVRRMEKASAGRTSTQTSLPPATLPSGSVATRDVN